MQKDQFRVYELSKKGKGSGILSSHVLSSRFNTSRPGLQVGNRPDNAWSRAPHVLLHGGVQPFKKQQQIHGVRRQMQLSVTLAMQKGKAIRAHQFLRLFAEHACTHVAALVAQLEDMMYNTTNFFF